MHFVFGIHVIIKKTFSIISFPSPPLTHISPCLIWKFLAYLRNKDIDKTNPCGWWLGKDEAMEDSRKKGLR